MIQSINVATLADVERRFSGLPTQLTEVRGWVLAHLPDEYSRRDDIAIAVSELATNAVVHSVSGQPGGTFSVHVRVTATVVELTVVDQGPLAVPAQRDADESGRGLEIVSLLSDDCKFSTTPERCTAWCRFWIANGGKL